jgi:hypothetical protein
LQHSDWSNSFDSIPDPTLSFSAAPIWSAGPCVWVSGQTYLNLFGLDPKHVARDAGALAALFACFAVAAYLALALKSGRSLGCGTR